MEQPEKFSSEQEAWNRVKSLALADQDDKEVAEVRYNKDACEAMVIYPDKTSCKFFAEKTDTPETLPMEGNTGEKQKAATLELGTYRLAGYNWTACELINNGKTLVLQSHGVTHGEWPGFVMPQSGNGDYYADSINVEDISTYDNKMKELYDVIKNVEDKSASYGKGLYLVSREKAGFTEWGEPGSGNYWTALKEAATNYSSFGASYDSVWLGTANDGGTAWYVYSGGNVYSNNQNYDFVIPPAFNIDLSKVEIVGDEIIIKKESAGQLENQSNSTPYRSIWEYGMDLTKDGKTFHLDPEMVKEICRAIKEDSGRNYVATFTSREFTPEQYIAVCDEVEGQLTKNSGDVEYQSCEKVLGKGFDKIETVENWVIKTMFTSEYESCTVRIPETLSSEKEAWDKVKELAIVDQDRNETTEVRYDRDACQVTVIHTNKAVCRIYAEKM